MSGNVVEQEITVREASLPVTRLMYLSEAFERTFEKGYLLA